MTRSTSPNLIWSGFKFSFAGPPTQPRQTYVPSNKDLKEAAHRQIFKDYIAAENAKDRDGEMMLPKEIEARIKLLRLHEGDCT